MSDAGEIALVSGARRLDKAQLAENIARAASGLRAAGIGRGDAVALLLRNDFAFFEASLAAQRLGAYAVPINWHFKPEEIEYILSDSGAKILVAHADLWPNAAPALTPGLKVFCVETPPEIAAAYGIGDDARRPPAAADDWDRWRDAQTPAGDLPAPSTDSMIYTSGTTGHPKAVRRNPATPEEAAHGLRLRKLVFGLEPGMVAAIPGPLYHSAPNSFGLRAIQLGGGAHLLPRFDPEGLLQTIEQERISHLFMVPTMFVRLLKLPQETRGKYDLSSLRYVIHAAAPCPREVKRAMIDWWGPIIHEFYGSTESSAVTLATSQDALERPGTVGRPTPGAEILILRDDGTPAPAGEAGEIYTRIEGQPDFTYHNKADKRDEIDHKGFITSGDVGWLDADGYLFISDRKRDMVISGGVNIYPAEIEAVALQMPEVKDCAVFGVPDAEFGEALMAVVEPQEGVDLAPAAVRAHMLAHLASYKAPKHIEIRRDLPREDSGKLFKRRLRDPYWEQAGRTI